MKFSSRLRPVALVLTVATVLAAVLPPAAGAQGPVEQAIPAVTLVFGQVVDQNGNPVENAFVSAFGPGTSFSPSGPPSTCPSTAPTGTATPFPPAATPPATPTARPPIVTSSGTSRDGSFLLVLTPGVWQLQTGGGRGSLVSGSRSTRTVTVGATTISDVVLTLYQTSGVIFGTVRGSDGQPVPGGQIEAVGSVTVGGQTDQVRGGGSIGSFGAPGFYVVPVITGTWSLTANTSFGPGGPSGDLNTGVAQVEVSSSATMVDINRLAPTTVITGILLDETGVPISRTTALAATLLPDATTPRAQTATTSTLSAADGTFRLNTVPGTWAISIAASGPVFPGVSPAVYLAPTGLTLSAPSTGNGVTLLTARNCIRGQIVTPDGQATGLGTVIGRLVNGPGTYESAGRPDPTGNFALPVAAGVWEVQAHQQGLAGSVPERREVPPDATGVRLQLLPITTASPTPTATYSPTPGGTPALAVFLPLVLLRGGLGGW